jgi:hypothetical protein
MHGPPLRPSWNSGMGCTVIIPPAAFLFLDEAVTDLDGMLTTSTGTLGPRATSSHSMTFMFDLASSASHANRDATACAVVIKLGGMSDSIDWNELGTIGG